MEAGERTDDVAILLHRVLEELVLLDLAEVPRDDVGSGGGDDAALLVGFADVESRRREAHLELAAGERAAGIARIDVLRALRVQEHADFEIRHHLRARGAGDFRRVADVIVMTVGDEDMGGSLDRLVEIAGKGRVALQERVDEDN